MDQAAVPKRFWWFKRIVAGFIVFAAATLGLRYVAVASAQRRLAKEVEAIRARGEPILPEDFLERPVAAEQNAAADLLKAKELWHVPAEHHDVWVDLSTTAFYSPQELTVIDAVLSANRDALTLMRRARRKPLVNWGLKIQSPAIGVMLSMLNDMRDFANSLSIASGRALQAGHDGEAVEDWRDTLGIVRATETQPFIISQLVANGISTLVSNKIYASARNLKIGDPTAASEAQVRALIDELLEEHESAQSGWKWGCMGERMAQLDLAYCLSGGKELPDSAFGQEMASSPLMWWLKPMLLADARGVLAASSVDIDAAGAPDAATATAKLGTIKRSSGARS